jgi:hypothetical protein
MEIVTERPTRVRLRLLLGVWPPLTDNYHFDRLVKRLRRPYEEAPNSVMARWVGYGRPLPFTSVESISTRPPVRRLHSPCLIFQLH